MMGVFDMAEGDDLHEQDYGGRRLADRRVGQANIAHPDRREGERRNGEDRRTTPRHYAR